MSKDEDVKKIVDILIDAGLGAKLSVKGIFKLAGTIYNAGFRDITDLKKWLKDWDYEEWDESYVNATPKAQGQIIMAKKILTELESL